jgi:predicted DNA-binding ribbon-helix-helix protein
MLRTTIHRRLQSNLLGAPSSIAIRNATPLAGGQAMKSSVVKRSVVVAGHKTSVSLEDAFWKVLKDMASERDLSLSDLVGTIDSQRRQGNLSSAIRLFVLNFYHDQIFELEKRTGTREILGNETVQLASKQGR